MRQCAPGMHNGHDFPAASAAVSTSRHYPKRRQASFYRAVRSPYLESVLRCSSGNGFVSGSHAGQFAVGKATTRYIVRTKIGARIVFSKDRNLNGCNVNRSRSIVAQAGNSSVADKDRTDFRIATLRRRRHFEIENTNAPALFAVIRATVA